VGFLASYIMKGRMQAMIVASTLAILSLILPPVSIVSSATVALVTLRLGAFEGFYVLAFSCVAAALLSFLVIGNYQFALLYGLVLWVPVWAIGIVLRETRSLSLALQAAVLFGVLGVIGFYLYNPQLSEMWKTTLGQMLPAGAPVVDMQRTIGVFSHYMTGVAAAGTVFSLLFGLLLGRWWQAMLYNPGGFKQEYLTLSATPKMGFASILVMLLAWASSGFISEVSWNVTILLFVMYIFIGTAVLHQVFSTMKLARYIVPMFYVTIFLIPHAMLPVALVGLSDAWVNLRNKFSNQHTPDGV